MAKITKVPNGPLIKKKGPFKGSTLKAGGKIKKAMMGMGSMFKDNPIYEKTTAMRGKLGGSALGIPGLKPIVKNGSSIKKAKNGTTTTKTTISPFEDLQKKKDSLYTENAKLSAKKDAETAAYLEQQRSLKQRFNEAKSKFSKKTKLGSIKAKSGAMIKRADGSMSRRGLWDNLRSKAAQNKKTGAKPKSPTKAMLVQEKKIKAKTKK